MHFLRVNFMFHDAVNMIHDVIRTATPFSYTSKFVFVGVRNDKTSTNQTLKDKQHIVVVYEKYLTWLEERINSPCLIRYF